MSQSTQNNVLQVIRSTPQAANDDAMLLDIYWHTYDGWDDNKSLYYNLSKATSSETITRSRRRLHEKGLIKYSKDADKARERLYKEYKEEYSERKPWWSRFQ